LRFNDGVEGEVDFSQKARTGVFAFWNNYKHFRLARVGDRGELLWNDQLDFLSRFALAASHRPKTGSAVEPEPATGPRLKSAAFSAFRLGGIETSICRTISMRFTTSSPRKFPSETPPSSMAHYRRAYLVA